MIYVILITYIAFTFWGSLIGLKNKNTTPESYFLADRNLTTLSLFFTILATNFSAFYFLGFAGQGYRIGYSFYTIMALGTGLASISFLLLGITIWKEGKENGLITPGEYVFYKTNNRILSCLFSGIMILFTFPYLSLQIIGGGYILENLTNGQIPYIVGVILLTLFTIAYVIIGGMSSVAKTDLKQGLLSILLMFLAVIIISYQLGGFEFANKQVFEYKPDLFQQAGADGFYTPKKWFSFIVFWFFCIPMFPQLFMRFYIAKDISHLKKATLLYASIPLIISIFPVIIGLFGHITFPNLVGKEADQILPMMLVEHTHPYFSAIIMTGAIAAFMSTLDSQLLALSTMLTRDFYIPFSKKSISFKTEVLLGRVFVAVFAMIGMIIAFKPVDTIFDMGKISFSGLAILFPIALFLTRKRIQFNPIAGIVAIIASVLSVFGFYYGWIPKEWSFGFETFMVSILLSFIISTFGIGKKKM